MMSHQNDKLAYHNILTPLANYKISPLGNNLEGL